MKRKISALILSVLFCFSIILSVYAASPANVTVSSATAKVNETVTLNVTVSDCNGAKSILIIPKFDDSILEIVSGKWLVSGIISDDFNSSTGDAVIAFDNNTEINKDIFQLVFKIKNETVTTTEVGCEIEIKTMDGLDEITVSSVVNNGIITIKKDIVSANGVVLNKKSLSLSTGASETLIATVLPENATNKAVTWESSNNDVATVDNNGKVTAVKKGTAKITVKTADGNFTDTCDVSVACSHAKTTTHSAVESTCTVQGNNEYVTCDDCGIVVSGSDAKLPLAAHKGGTATCKDKAVCEVCSNAYGNLADHSYTEKVDAEYLKSAANCASAAVYYKSCKVCGTAGTATFTSGSKDAANHIGETEIKNAVDATCTANGYTGDTYCKACGEKTADGKVIAAGHKTVKVEKVDATHEKDGNIEYYTCSGCDKLFENAAATKEITLADTVIAKGEHNYGDFESDENNHWKACGCGNVIEKAEHTYGEWTTTKEATETEKGVKERTCDVCGYKATEEIPAVKNETDADVDSNKPATDEDQKNDNTQNSVNDNSGKAPQTGDNHNIALWIVLVSVSGLAVIGIITFKKRVR